jgi:hypothetical protein
LTSVFFILTTQFAAADADEDHRAWQHGVNLIAVGDKLLLVWGSPGNPPKANVGGDWQHDVYYDLLDVASINIIPPDQELIPVNPKVLVAMPEAQEPPSVAVNHQGNILMTSEDGNGGINQHAGLWNSELQVIRRYPFTIRRGGHSGHVAAIGNQFMVTYGEGWIDGGGWRNLGTGESIYARIVDSKGKVGRELKLTEAENQNPRDSWPLVACSSNCCLAIWQRYPALRLQAVLIDLSGKVFANQTIMDDLPARYSYDVEYSADIGSYIVAGTSGDHGFISLVSQTGRIIKTRHDLPPMAAESRLVLRSDGRQLTAVYPVSPKGVAVLNISNDSIALLRVIDKDYVWDYAGTTGLFTSPDQVLFATLSTSGIKLLAIKITD